MGLTLNDERKETTIEKKLQLEALGKPKPNEVSLKLARAQGGSPLVHVCEEEYQ